MNELVTRCSSPRSLVEERKMRPPTIGKIRPGIKVLKSSARGNARAAQIYSEMCDEGESFEAISKAIESQCNLRDPLVPKNVPHFTCRRSDFNNGDVADEILRLYGENRGDGIKLYKFPVLFAFNDWMDNLPNELAVYGTAGRKYFSEYGRDGVRYCKTYEKPVIDPHAKRVRRHFGGRVAIFRQDDAIQSVCDPEMCPQYQAQQCRLSASFIFAVPEVKGLGLIELPTNSIYVLQKAYSAMQTVLLARGRLTGTKFWLSKREFDITRINDAGEAVRQKQILTVLDADIDMGALLDAAEDSVPVLEAPFETPPVAEPLGRIEEAPDAPPLVATPSVDPHGDAFVPAVPADESLEDKVGRLGDLLARLGIKTKPIKDNFTVYARQIYGRQWTQRAADVDAMNQTLTLALESPAAFLESLNTAALDVLVD